MALAPDENGTPREVVIQLIPAPFSQGWVENIRLLSRSSWYDGTSINRVQDNYVVQWGDPNYDNPETGGEAKPLPDGLRVMGEDAYVADLDPSDFKYAWRGRGRQAFNMAFSPIAIRNAPEDSFFMSDPYGPAYTFAGGFPIAVSRRANKKKTEATLAQLFGLGGLSDQNYAPELGWPVHCYGMVGVGRGYSPDTGSGAELYTVIGHAPRHLDRNIALVGRIIDGIEHLSALPRGSGALGFYGDAESDLRTSIQSIKLVSDLAGDDSADDPDAHANGYHFEYLDAHSQSFAEYAAARANRRDPFFIHPAGGADICNIPVPVRRVDHTDHREPIEK